MISAIFIVSFYILGSCSAESGYVLTTPFTWISGFKSQICVAIIDGSFSSEDDLQYSLFGYSYSSEDQNYTKYSLRDNTEISFTAGISFECVDVTVPEDDTNILTLSLEGTLNSETIDSSINLTLSGENERVFISTDKYLYKPGQKVQFRILTIRGPNIEVVTETYEEIYVENPSGVRIAQWNNVNNSAGLVHLFFDLYTEIEEGYYTIYVSNTFDSKHFEVRDYVLPRFEVIIDAPETFLGSDETITVRICATYVFGEPVEGNATIYAAVGYEGGRGYANISQTGDIKGCRNFTFNTDDLLFDYNNCHIRTYSVEVIAIVEEEGTGVVIYGDTVFFTIHRTAITFVVITIRTVDKPYLPVFVEIEVKHASGLPAVDELMEVCTYYDGEEICKNFTTDSQGILSFVIPSQIQPSVTIRAVKYPRIENKALYNDVMEASEYSVSFNDYQEYVDPTNTSLTIVKKMVECTSGEDIELTIPVIYVTTTEIIVDVYVQIQSRGQALIFKEESVELSGSDLDIREEDLIIPVEVAPPGVILGKFEIKVTLDEIFSPELTILVWFSNENGTVVADSLTVDVSYCLPHKVNFTWSTPKAEPGEEVTLMIKGGENSLCSIGVVDKSVEILSSGNNENLDISAILSLAFTYSYGSQTNLRYCIEKYGPNFTEGATSDSYYGIVQALHEFNEAGYAVLSNLYLERIFCAELIYQDLKNDFDYDYGGGPVFDGGFGLASNGLLGSVLPLAPGGGGAGLSGPERGVESSDSSDATIRERSNLPETWLWLLRTLSETGELDELMTLPDTITTWVGSAVCVSSELGVGISNIASILTFLPFFVDIILPSSAVRGEILPLTISIFNYLEEDLPVAVFIEESINFEFIEGESGSREICVPAQSMVTVTVSVNLTQIGTINITVQATSEPSLNLTSCGSSSSVSKGDRLIELLLVEPEGYLRERVFTEYICSGDTPSSFTWSFVVPDGAVEDSGRAWVTAVGDLLGPTIENLGYLIRMPFGCGEQNMINFAPNVYILQYLNVTNQITQELEETLKRFLREGYQRELKFKRTDGSYSTFGEADKEGSTWLTAFVVKSFAQADAFIDIDEKSLQESIDWLLNLQGEDGCFEAKGRVINKMLQGGFSGSEDSKSLLTAYVLAALLEGGRLENRTIIDLAVECINTSNSKNPYSLALICYCLALAGAENTGEKIEELLKLADTDATILRWNLPGSTGEVTTPLQVETAAYALLAILTFDPVQYEEEARKILRWLTNQMNGQGGFVSTQDTIVALQALSAYQKTFPQGELNIEVTVSAADFTTTFTITELNKFLQQRKDLPSLPSEVTIDANGTGCALVQGVLRYNVLADSISDAFSLNVDVDCNDNKKIIKICVSYNLPDEASNMVIIEIKLVTGYAPNENDIEEIVEGDDIFELYEINGKFVTLYLEEVTENITCFEFEVKQEINVDSAKPGSVSVTDYYQPQYKATRTLHLNNVSCSD